jgi:acetyl-CoA acetyltransferase
MHDFGTRAETFAAASSLMHEHALGNPRARYRKACSIEEVLASPVVSDPLHLLEICAVSDGAAALVLGTEAQARQRGGPMVRVAGCAAATGHPSGPAGGHPGTPRGVRAAAVYLSGHH